MPPCHRLAAHYRQRRPWSHQQPNGNPPFQPFASHLHSCPIIPDHVLNTMQIFQKAISSSSAYDDQFKQLISAGKDAESAYWELVIKDIQDACKLFEPIYDETDGADGYVSVEVSPRLANDTQGTVEAAKWLHKVVNRPNVYIKIPATAECVPSIQEVIANGISVNVTVIAEFCIAHCFHMIVVELDSVTACGKIIVHIFVGRCCRCSLFSQLQDMRL
jgi:transaldolase